MFACSGVMALKVTSFMEGFYMRLKTLRAKNPSEARGIRKALRFLGVSKKFKFTGKPAKRRKPAKKRKAAKKGKRRR